MAYLPPPAPPGGDAGSYQQMLGSPCVCAPARCSCWSLGSRGAAIGVVCAVLGSAATLLVAYIHKLRRRANAAANPAPPPAFGVPVPPPPPYNPYA